MLSIYSYIYAFIGYVTYITIKNERFQALLPLCKLTKQVGNLF